MPLFIIDCCESALKYHDEEVILEHIHRVAYSTGLFDEANGVTH